MGHINGLGADPLSLPLRLSYRNVSLTKLCTNYSHLESFGVNFRSLTTVPDDVISCSSFCLRLWKSSELLFAAEGSRGGAVTLLPSGEERETSGELRTQPT